MKDKQWISKQKWPKNPILLNLLYVTNRPLPLCNELLVKNESSYKLLCVTNVQKPEDGGGIQLF